MTIQHQRKLFASRRLRLKARTSQLYLNSSKAYMATLNAAPVD
jgi:hypothetical protein